MDIKFNVTKENRKGLVAAIGELTGCESSYQGAPSFAFAVSNYVVDRNGILVSDDRMTAAEIRTLLTGLAERGFVFEGSIDEIAPITSPSDETVSDDDVVTGENERIPENENSATDISIAESLDSLVVEIPLMGFTKTAFDNLDKLVEGKAALMTKAFKTNSLTVERTETALRFPWFSLSANEGEIDAYTQFVTALCDMAKKQKRVTLKEADVDSEKFAFRCFLLRLGFIGNEFKSARKILLSNMEGNASFKSGNHKRDVAQEVVTIADSGEENTEAVTVHESENGAGDAVTGGVDAAYAYNPNLTDYDELMTGREN